MRQFAGVLAVMLFLLPVIALAEESDDTPDRALLLVLDASGSMDREDTNGVRLIDGAKQALLDLVDTLPEDLHVGLRVYGHRYPNTDRTNGCTDTELIVPIGPLDRDVMRAAVESFDALGYTPIGLSLQEAASDFPPDVTTKAIVLVSDGEDTCAPPDPCEVARQLFERGIFVRIETVGLVLDEAGARDQLQCIAEATGGTYHDVGSIDILERELGTITENAIAGPEGLLFGGLTKAQATPLHTCCPLDDPPPGVEGMWMAESGLFRTPLRQGQTLWFSLSLQDLQASDFDAALALPDGVEPNGYLELAVFDETGEEVAWNREGFGPRRSLIADNPRVWATMGSIDEASGDLGPPPMWPGTYYVSITWDAPPAELSGEVELRIETHEAVGDYAVFVANARGDSVEAQLGLLVGGPTQTAATVFPTGFAANLEPGSGAEDVRQIRIHPGEMLWYSIELKDLQSARVGVHGLEVPAFVTAPGYLDVRMFDEDGDEMGMGSTDGFPRRSIVSGDTAAGASMKELPAGVAPELWPGTYYIRIWWDAPDDDSVAEPALSVAVDQFGGQEGSDIRRDRQETSQSEAIDTTPDPEPLASETVNPTESVSLPLVLLGVGLLVALALSALLWIKHRR